jgi:hypothetical protein
MNQIVSDNSATWRKKTTHRLQDRLTSGDKRFGKAHAAAERPDARLEKLDASTHPDRCFYRTAGIYSPSLSAANES